MKNKKFIAIAIVAAVVAFFLTRVIWPDPVGASQPAPNLIPFFIIVTLFEAMGFGVGVALLVTAWKRVVALPWVYGSVIWLLASWWPHDSLHRIGEAEGFVYLLKLEFGFHVTLIIAGLILAQYLLKMDRQAVSVA